MDLSDVGIVSDLPGDDTNDELLRVLNGTLVRQITGEKGSQDGKPTNSLEWRDVMLDKES